MFPGISLGAIQLNVWFRRKLVISSKSWSAKIILFTITCLLITVLGIMVQSFTSIERSIFYIKYIGSSWNKTKSPNALYIFSGFLYFVHCSTWITCSSESALKSLVINILADVVRITSVKRVNGLLLGFARKHDEQSLHTSSNRWIHAVHLVENRCHSVDIHLGTVHEHRSVERTGYSSW